MTKQQVPHAGRGEAAHGADISVGKEIVAARETGDYLNGTVRDMVY